MEQSALHTTELVAQPGPRVRAPRKHVASSRTSTASPRGLVDGPASVEACAMAVARLYRDSASRLAARPLDDRDPVRHFSWLVPATAIAPIVALSLGAAWWAAAALFAVGSGLGLHWTRCLSRRVAVLAREISAELDHGVDPLDMAEEIEALVALDPGNDPARCTLARVRIEQDDFVGALLQLAPLRDRHPDDGSVVLLAAIAYARMGSTADALRMLEALQIEPEHVWTPELERFRDACARDVNAAQRASGDESDFDTVDS